eukprot:Amastigsp_a176390_40.p8 type:complete len:105 gc:universal Amastigsp_a176390_40:312-626(+)
MGHGIPTPTPAASRVSRWRAARASSSSRLSRVASDRMRELIPENPALTVVCRAASTCTSSACPSPVVECSCESSAASTPSVGERICSSLRSAGASLPRCATRRL